MTNLTSGIIIFNKLILNMLNGFLMNRITKHHNNFRIRISLIHRCFNGTIKEFGMVSPFKTENVKVKVLLHIEMGQVTKEIGKITKNMVKEYSKGLIITNMMGNGKMTKRKDQVKNIYQMAIK